MYKCKNCGGPLKYHIESGKIACMYCGDSNTVEEYSKKCSTADESLSVFTCPFCGGEIVTNDTAITDFCSYCGSPAMLQRREETRTMPRKIVPFSVTLDECEKQYMNYISKIPYLPKEYKSEERVLDFRGIYVPYHSYSVQVNGKVHYFGKDDTLQSGRKHRVDEYDVTGNVSGKVTGVIHDASKSFLDKTSEAISFGKDQGVPFHPAYLSGFFADFADVEPEEYYDFAKNAAEQAAELEIAKSRVTTKSGARIVLSEEKKDLNFEVSEEAQILRPVWFMSRKAKDRVAYAVIDGKTKNTAADLPVDTKKFRNISLIISFVIFLLLEAGMTMTPKGMNAMACFLNLILTWAYFKNVQDIYQREVSTREEKKKSFLGYGGRRVALIIALCILGLFVLEMLMESPFSGSSLFLILQIYLLLKNWKKWSAVEREGTHPTRWIIGSYLASFFLIGLRVFNPVDDIWYYIGGICSLAVTIIVMFRIIADYNLVCTQPLPQFAAYKGGMQNDER